MRNPRRIPIIAKIFSKFLDNFIYDLDTSFQNIKISKSEYPKIIKFWKEHPDLRLTQVLVNLNYIPNLEGFWYYTDEVNWLVIKGYFKFEEINFWGKNYNEDGTPLPKTEWILVKDLTDSHIQNILKFFKDNKMILSRSYLSYFNSRLNKS
jgi:hypothetical protein